MFWKGNGMSDQQTEPPSSGAMWANMLGLGPLMQTVQDPQFLAQIKAIADAITSTSARTERVENLCHAILARLPADPAVSGRVGTDGVGTSPATSGAVDDGIGFDARTAPPLGVSGL
jgi:hypothetical protein